MMKAFSGLLAAWLALSVLACAEQPALTRFITAKGDQLFEGDAPFRFISCNVPNLHLIEDNFSFTNPNPWRWPNQFEISDALETIRQMGGKVTRTYVLSVKRNGSDMGDHAYVRGPGDFNETAFRVLDKVLQIANEKGVRVIIPLVDNWQWWGGCAEYASFRGKSPKDFWSDEQVIRDFEETIQFTLNRVNTITGVAYKDDPAIFGWETGNELDSTVEWTRRISAFIKSHDANHLVIDGYALHGVRQASLDDQNVDVITTHHYPNTDMDYVEAIAKSHAMTVGKKPYFVGEFGFAPTTELIRVMNTIDENHISGGLLWSLRFHNRDGGFYWHSEPSGGNLYKSYHWPGFSSGNAYDERNLLRQIRSNAFQIVGEAVPPVPLPAAPRLLPITDVGAISWQGSAGADSYDVYRAVRKQGPWRLVGNGISDAAVQYRPLFCDRHVEIGMSYYYRLLARNEVGSSPPSNTVGPVQVRGKVLVDECRDFRDVFHRTGDVHVLEKDARRTQEDAHRFQLKPESSVVYQFDEPIQNWRVMLFSTANAQPLVESSVDGAEFSSGPVDTEQIAAAAGDYGYSQPWLLTGRVNRSGARYLRIKLGKQLATSAGTPFVEISRVEIVTGPAVTSAALSESPFPSESELRRRGAPLNPSILVYHKPRHTKGVQSIRHAAALGSRRVNVVVTLLCELNEDREVLSYGMIKKGKYVRLNERLLASFRDALSAVFAEAVAHDIDLSVLAHLNSGGKIYDWRNHFRFDPLVEYQGYSYQQAVLAPIRDALKATAKPARRVDFSLAGEMGTSVFSHAASYTKLLAELRRDMRLPNLRLGLSFNFSSVAGEGEVSPGERRHIQQLVNACDFVGLSNYRSFDLPIEANDFAEGVKCFLAEMQSQGAILPTSMPLHFSEVGIGGGKEEGLATTPLEASEAPWNGTDEPQQNPWRLPEMQKFRVEFHRSLLEFLAKPTLTNPVTEAYLWSEGSWDPMDITDQGFADPEIITLIQTHNDKMASD